MATKPENGETKRDETKRDETPHKVDEAVQEKAGEERSKTGGYE